VIGLDRFAIYVFDYGAPTGFRLAARHPERITAIISQNGNAYVEGLSDGWNPIRTYWQDPSDANRTALRAFLLPATTVWQYTHGVADSSSVSPDGYSLDNFYLARPGADEVQLDLFGDYKSNVAVYPEFQAYFRKHKPPLLAAWGKNDPFFLPAGAEAFKRDIPGADVRFFDTGHFALETHCDEIAAAIRDFLSRSGRLPVALQVTPAAHRRSAGKGPPDASAPERTTLAVCGGRPGLSLRRAQRSLDPTTGDPRPLALRSFGRRAFRGDHHVTRVLRDPGRARDPVPGGQRDRRLDRARTCGCRVRFRIVRQDTDLARGGQPICLCTD
jgi:hypothetical protein